MSISESKPFLWLSEILEDPEVLKPPRAIVPRLVWHERITLLVAQPKGGKSTLASAAAASVSSGCPFLGTPTKPGNVLIISLEEHANDFAPRLVRFGADPSRIAIVSQPWENLTLIETIWAAAEQMNPSLIIWDTLGAFANRVANRELEPGDSQGWTTVMQHIVDLARAYGATLLLHHARRSDGRYRDSSAIAANVDAIMELRGEKEEPRTLRGIARFEIPETTFRMQGDEMVLVESEKEFRQRVLDFIKTHPRTSTKDIREALGVRKERVGKAVEELVKNGAIVNQGGLNKHSFTAVGVVPV